MELKIVEEKNNPLLNRKEVVVDSVFSGKTPAKEETKKELAKLLKTDEKLLSLQSINQEYGSNKARLSAYVYNTSKDLESMEEVKKSAKEESKKQSAEQKVEKVQS